MLIILVYHFLDELRKPCELYKSGQSSADDANQRLPNTEVGVLRTLQRQTIRCCAYVVL